MSEVLQKELDRILRRINRRRTMKRGGEAYSAAARHETWIEISRPYLVEGWSEDGPKRDLVTVVYDKYREILADLRQINERRSKKGRV
jgi:hypothetical protein